MNTANTQGGLLKKDTEKKEITPQQQMRGMLNKMLPDIQKAVGKTMTAERFSRIALSLFNGNSAFWDASPTSFLSALMQSAQCGLEPNTVLGEAYVIPYKNNNKNIMEINFQLGYKGVLKLAFNSGEYEAIYAHEVREGDEFSYSYGLNKDLIHKPSDKPSTKVTHYYAVYKMKNGGFDFVVWSRDKIEEHAREFSKNYLYKGQVNKSSVWYKNFDAMAKKTVLIDVLKYAPKSVEMARAFDLDYKSNTKEEKQSEFNAVDVDSIPIDDSNIIQDATIVDENQISYEGTPLE